MKVICAGLPKTGTKSMATTLQILGYTVHDAFEQYYFDKELWQKILDSEATIDDFRKTYGNVDAVTDVPACGFWEKMSEAFPEAKIILMVRPEDDWVASLQNQCAANAKNHTLRRWGVPDFLTAWLSGPLARDAMGYLRTSFIQNFGWNDMFKKPSEILIRSKFRQHNSYVKSVCPKDKLLVYQVKDGWVPLCNFLGVPIPDQPFPRRNIKASLHKEILSGIQNDYGYVETVKRQFFARFCILLALTACFISLLVFMFA